MVQIIPKIILVSEIMDSVRRKENWTCQMSFQSTGAGEVSDVGEVGHVVNSSYLRLLYIFKTCVVIKFKVMIKHSNCHIKF